MSPNNFRIPFLLLFILVFFHPLMAEDQGEKVDTLEIKSTTALCSAQFYLDGGNGNEEDDKKRTSIGIGEEFTLELEGKPKGEIDKLKWSFEEGQNLVDPVSKAELEGKDSLTLKVRKDITPKELEQDASIRLTVTTSDGNKGMMEEALTVVFPSGMQAKHKGS